MLQEAHDYIKATLAVYGMGLFLEGVALMDVVLRGFACGFDVSHNGELCEHTDRLLFITNLEREARDLLSGFSGITDVEVVLTMHDIACAKLQIADEMAETMSEARQHTAWLN